MNVGIDRKRRALSLMEVVMAVAVIAILAAIVFAVSSAVIERSRNVDCTSKLRAIGIGLNLFVAEKGYYMGANTSGGRPWHEALEPYMGGGEAGPDTDTVSDWLQCPVRNQIAGEPVIGYGYNYLGFGHHPPESGRWDDVGADYMKTYWHVTPARIENPAGVIVVGDNHDPGQGDNRIDRLLYNTLSGSAFSSRHRGGANYLFADCHVRWMTPAELAEELQKDGGRKTIMRPF